MAFYIYDIVFLVLFCLAVVIFLYRKRKNLNREGIMYLYRTQAGIRFIKKIGNEYKKTLGVLKYVIIVVSYILMASIIYLIFRSAYIYVKYPVLITKIVKAPPIAPVIPYFPKLFGMESFFPPFYFTYFLVAIAIVAIVHEFSHGIFMIYNKIRIKSTGIVFLGPILGAFVEQNDKDMEKRSKTAQMSILGAGVFANIITGIVFFLIWVGLFYASFIPSGANFDSYGVGVVNITSISMIGGIQIINNSNQGIIELINKNNITDSWTLGSNGEFLNYTKIIAQNKTYFINMNIFKQQLNSGGTQAGLYEDLPAINAQMKGAIISINNNKINSYSDLGNIMKTYKPGDKIKIETEFNTKILTYDITLSRDENNYSRAIIGVGNRNVGVNMADSFAIFKDPFTNYKTRSEFLVFLYFMVFWIFLINVLVAFFNMLPASILDGGRFFYLTVWGITGKEKIGKVFYKWAGILILAAFVLMMLSWVFGITR